MPLTRADPGDNQSPYCIPLDFDTITKVIVENLYIKPLYQKSNIFYENTSEKTNIGKKKSGVVKMTTRLSSQAAATAAATAATATDAHDDNDEYYDQNFYNVESKEIDRLFTRLITMRKGEGSQGSNLFVGNEDYYPTMQPGLSTNIDAIFVEVDQYKLVQQIRDYMDTFCPCLRDCVFESKQLSGLEDIFTLNEEWQAFLSYNSQTYNQSLTTKVQIKTSSGIVYSTPIFMPTLELHKYWIAFACHSLVQLGQKINMYAERSPPELTREEKTRVFKHECR